MNERDRRQNIERVLLGDIPVNLRRMSKPRSNPHQYPVTVLLGCPLHGRNIQPHLPLVMRKLLLELPVGLEVHHYPRIVLPEGQIQHSFDKRTVGKRECNRRLAAAVSLGHGNTCTHHQRMSQCGSNNRCRRSSFRVVRSKYPSVKGSDLPHLIGVSVETNRRERSVYESSEARTGRTIRVSRQFDHLYVAAEFTEIGFAPGLGCSGPEDDTWLSSPLPDVAPSGLPVRVALQGSLQNLRIIRLPQKFL